MRCWPPSRRSLCTLSTVARDRFRDRVPWRAANNRLSRAIVLYRDYLPAHFAGVEFINAWRAGRKLGGQLISFKFTRRPDSPPNDDGDQSVHGCTADPLTTAPTPPRSQCRTLHTSRSCRVICVKVEAEMTSVERVLHYCSAPTERYDGSAAAGDDSGGGGGGGGGEWPPLDSRVVFDRVELRYRPGLPLVLKAVSFAIEAGTKLGVVGRIGSGKSSLVQALFRMVEPCGGRITVGGVDTARLGVAELRSALAICPQDPVIFSGTVAKNLSPFDEHSTAEIETALRRVGLQISPHAAVQESGANLSGGMRQLLCLARTLLRDSKVLVLDEATSAISTEVDTRIQRVLREAFSRTTMLVIAHRLQTTLDADAVLVLAAGCLCEFGSPAELMMQRGGSFRAMIDETSSGLSSVGEPESSEPESDVSVDRDNGVAIEGANEIKTMP
eukprot:SAG22_NODE_254_length_13588_cov_10.695678_3_plen_443_part_00